MTTDNRPRPPATPAAAGAANELKRIPLPPLPHFRRPGSDMQASPARAPLPSDAPAEVWAGPVSHLEMSELLGPDHEGGSAPALDGVAPQRTGTTGATILNDLVDEIEKGLEKELARAPIGAMTHGYRRVLACSGGIHAGPGIALGLGRRTGE